MPRLRRILAGAVVATALVGAIVYGGLRFADSVNHDLAAPPPAPSPSDTWLPAPYGTLSPAQYHYGKAVAHGAAGDVVAYTPRHQPHGVLTVPFTITNHGSKPYDYEIAVLLSGATASGVPQSARISSDGLLPPNATMSTEINFESGDDVPVQDIDVRITDVEKRGTSDNPS
ncbi:hypothetical protein ACGF3G_29150 [Streptomyces sp. NPDC048179]|uniref:hypothetical protein n=1 Tax=Streptomyces sp. NPDC048179 TaxID=3365506 RepID=UPI0037179727